MTKLLQVVGIMCVFTVIFISALGAWDTELEHEEQVASHNEWKMEVSKWGK